MQTVARTPRSDPGSGKGEFPVKTQLAAPGPGAVPAVCRGEACTPSAAPELARGQPDSTQWSVRSARDPAERLEDMFASHRPNHGFGPAAQRTAKAQQEEPTSQLESGQKAKPDTPLTREGTGRGVLPALPSRRRKRWPQGAHPHPGTDGTVGARVSHCWGADTGKIRQFLKKKKKKQACAYRMTKQLCFWALIPEKRKLKFTQKPVHGSIAT